MWVLKICVLILVLSGYYVTGLNFKVNQKSETSYPQPEIDNSDVYSPEEWKDKVTKNKYVVTPCTSNPCKNGGKCSASRNSFTCKCVDPFLGRTCEIRSPCASNPCKNGGNCRLYGSGFVCDCVIPFGGKTCQIRLCEPNPCKNGGKCFIKKFGGFGANYFICGCHKEFSGKFCELGPCTPNPCKNNGKCRVEGQSFECSCTEPWKGKTCETACVCKGGTCELQNDDVVCRCKPGYGNFTTHSCRACDCGPDSSCFWRAGMGGKVCICKPGYQEKFGKCVDCECGPDSNCTLISDGWRKPIKKVCHCQQGYYEKDGKCVAIETG